MQKTIQEWFEIAKYDLRTAQALLKTRRYLYVAFMCQQAIEKILKAIYVQKKNELPPMTHNLLYLVEILEFAFDEKKLMLLSRLNQFYIESRYPGERSRLAKEVNHKQASEILKESQEVWLCLKQTLR